MDDTLGIDCPKSYAFDNSLIQDTPRRLSTDFDHGIVGDGFRAKRLKVDPEIVFNLSMDRPHTRSLSTPRRSLRLAAKAEPSPANKIRMKPRTYPARTVLPRTNRTLELRRKEAQIRSGKRRKSNAAVMKPFFSKPKLQTTVPITPELVRRMRKMRKEPLKGYKSFKDKEDEEVDMMKKYKFVANPIPKAVTANKAGPSRVKSNKSITKAVSPKLTKNKKRKFAELEQPFEFKAKPLPNLNKPSTIKKMERKPITVKPFEFDKRYADPNIKKKEMIEAALEKCKKMAEFKATPYYGFQNENTKPSVNKTRGKGKKKAGHSFELPGEAISRKKREAFAEKIRKEEEEKIAKRKFTATTSRAKQSMVK